MRFQHTSLISSLSVASLLLASLFVGSTAETKSQQGNDSQATMLFVVSAPQPSLASIVPVAIIENGQFKQTVAGDSDQNEVLTFSNAYYSKGHKYRLLFGGGDAGSLTIKNSNKDSECAKTSADVMLKTQVKLNQNAMALATNSDSLGKGKSTRRSPTPAERAALMPLVKAAYKKMGVPASLMPSLTTLNLTALDLDSDGRSELIGSFVVKKQKGGAARYVLFLFAEPEGNSYRTTVLQNERFTKADIMAGAAITAIDNGVYLERLVDALDVDGDGASEVVTIREGLEGDGYAIYKKQNGKWDKAYEFSNYKCGF
jgi:hypothetical protein